MDPSALARRRPLSTTPSSARYAPSSPATNSSIHETDEGEEEKVALRDDVPPSARRGRREWVMRSYQKHEHPDSDSDSDSGDDDDRKRGGKEIHLSKRQKTGCIAVTLLLIIGISAFVYYKWGTEVYADVKDFVIFPTVTTPVDLTSAVMSVVSLVTSKVVGAESTATSKIVGAESTATAAVVGAATTAAAAITSKRGRRYHEGPGRGKKETHSAFFTEDSGEVF
ncbi:hypothetical protein JCM5296_002249 [Sporobolomyces johnsonii]